MKIFWSFIFLIVFHCSINAQSQNDRLKYTSNFDKRKIESLKNQMRAENDISRSNISKHNFPATFIGSDSSFNQLQGVTDSGIPLYYQTNNNGCATTIRATNLYSGGSLGLNVQGQNMIAGVWDGGATRIDHDHFQGRVLQKDNSTMGLSSHATHVTGTICQNKTNSPISRGMAFDSSVWANDWNSDTLEAIEQAQEGLLVSNHSYGFGAFDAQGALILPVYFFGAYIQTSRNWDLIMNQFPNYLMVTAAGNDRQSANLMTDKGGGYDILSGTKISKNNIVVGAINNMPSYTNSNSPVMSNFSSWGPCDDGRIKPDLVAKGVNVSSTTSLGSVSATTTMSGTSMASPSIAGGLLLLQQHYNNVNGNFMLAATLKGLALHTASEAGSSIGPDYRFGWGVLNCTAAADVISKNGLTSRIQELTLNPGQTIVLNVRAAGGNIPLMASISWNDPAGTTNNGIIDSRLPALVNDLNLRLSKGEDLFFPWKLDPANPANAATKGDNLVDPFERVEVMNASGSYTVVISHKGSMATPQKFSLIVSGEANDFSLRTNNPSVAVCFNQTATFSLQHITSNTTTTNFSITGLPAGVNATLSTNSINSNGNFGLTLSNLSFVPAGKYIFEVRGQNGTFSNFVDLELNVFGTTFSPVQNQTPVNLATSVPLIPNLTWLNNINAQSYVVQIAKNANFTSGVQTLNAINNSVQTELLSPNTTYFWRVKSVNNCGESAFGPATQFKTLDLICSEANNNTVSNIASTANTLVNSTLVFSNSQITTIFDVDVNVNITHTYVQDMTLKLTSPQGTVVILQAEACGEENDINATYDDSGNAIVCSQTPPAIFARVKPSQLLSTFNGENPNGTWTLTVDDPWNGDGGTLNNWKLNICSQANLGRTDFNFNNSITIYPSPVQNILSYKIDDGLTVNRVEMFDISGKKLNTQAFAGNQFDVSHLQSGVYFLKFFVGNQTITKKIIKQ
jgi:subtilisin-like proprotein convertase family protein